MTTGIVVYGAFRVYPDYNAPPPALISLHSTLAGAMAAFGSEVTINDFRPMRKIGDWIGFDYTAIVRSIEVQHP